jgi:hypothetical protein
VFAPSVHRPAAAVAVLAAATFAVAQAPPAKRPLKHSDYDIWNTASAVTLSADGKWLAYTLLPAEGDGAVVVRSLTSDVEHRVARGGRPSTEGAGDDPAAPSAPPAVPAVGRSAGLAGPGGGPQFTPDGKRLLFSLPPTKAEVDKARGEKRRPDEQPRGVLAVFDLAAGKVVERIPKVRAFAVAGEGTGYLVMHKEPAADAQPSPGGTGAVAGGLAAAQTAPQPPAGGATPAPGGGRTGRFQGRGAGGPPGATPTPPAAPRPAFGTELVVRNLADGTERTFADVAEYSVSKDARVLVYAVASRRDDTNGVYAVDLDSQAGPFPVRGGKGKYTRLTWDEKQDRLAFFYDDAPTLPPVSTSRDEPARSPTPATPEPTRPPAKLRVFVWERPRRTEVAAIGGAAVRPTFREAAEVLGPTTPGLKTNFVISDRGGLRFTEDGKKLAVSVAPAPAETPAPARPATPAAAADRIDLDLWHWKDEIIQPMQKVRGGTDRQRSFSAAYFFDTKEFRQLSDENVTVGVPDHGDWAVSSNDKPYRYLTGYGANLADHALVNVRTGERKPVLTASTGGLTASPKGTAAVTFDGKDWYGVAVPAGTRVNLTAKLPVRFYDEEFDSPMEPPSYGLAGWTPDEKHVLLYDRCDVWKVAVDGSGATNLTQTGRGLKIRFRVVRLRSDEDESERGIDPAKSLLLAATNLNTMDTGFYRLEPGGPPKLLLMAASNRAVRRSCS